MGILEMFRKTARPELVGAFAKPAPPRVKTAGEGHHPSARFDPVLSPPGTAAEEATRGDISYLEVLATLHQSLAPSLYLEIGVRHGRSLELARGPAVGVDPAPELDAATLQSTTQVIALTSDDYFATMNDHPLPQAPGLAFIDGMHLFEFALRDFMHLERLAAPETLVVIDDICPSHPAQAERNRRTRVWTGDIWKLRRCLAELRPDLILLALDTAPTGLLLVAGLDPANRTLWDRYDAIVLENEVPAVVPASVLMRTGVISPTHPALANLLAVLRHSRGAARVDILARLRTALAAGGVA